MSIVVYRKDEKTPLLMECSLIVGLILNSRSGG